MVKMTKRTGNQHLFTSLHVAVAVCDVPPPQQRAVEKEIKYLVAAVSTKLISKSGVAKIMS